MFLRPRPAESGSIAMALLLILVGVSLSLVLLPMVATQVRGTVADDRRVRALHAAQAGLDVALGQIRGAQGGALTSLPCGTDATPLAGDVTTGSVGRTSYRVTIDYFVVDPGAHWNDPSWIAGNRVACYPGSGVVQGPKWVLLRSTGIDAATGGTRVLHGTYQFRTTDDNIAGGLIHVAKSSACLDAGSDSPAAGSVLRTDTCDALSSRQKFSYNKDLTLTLVSTRTDTSRGMCLDADTPHAVGSQVRFQPCLSPVAPRQQWSFNDHANFEGTADGRNLDHFCFNVLYSGPNALTVILDTTPNCRAGGDDKRWTFAPDAAVGAGAASIDTTQLVNFSQFGRCLDVTQQDYLHKHPEWDFMIAWPCKQSPDPTLISWNQRWTMPTFDATTHVGVGQLKTNPSGGWYCLLSPGVEGGLVLLRPCPAVGTEDDMVWTVRRDLGEPEQLFRIEDYQGLCMTPDPDPAHYYTKGDQVSKIIVSHCTESTLQKWDADPNVLAPQPLTNLGEK